MANEITQRQLQSGIGEIMRRLDRGESFVVTRNGVPMADLTPVRRRRFVPREIVINAFKGAPRIDGRRYRADLDAIVDQDPTPRA